MKNYFVYSISTLLFGSCLFSSLFAEDFVVGTSSAYAPYVSLDEKGDYVGFDIDFANELSKKLNRDLVLKDLGSMPALILALKQGKIDALIWGMSITQDRQKQMEMIYYQGGKMTSLPMLFWKQIPENVTSLESMANNPKMVICAEAGSFQDSFLQKVPGLALKQVDKVTDAMMEIKYGKSVATVIDPSLLATVTQQFPELKVMEAPLPPLEQSLGYGVCLNKKSCKLILLVKKAVDELRKEGVIAELEKKWNLAGG